MNRRAPSACAAVLLAAALSPFALPRLAGAQAESQPSAQEKIVIDGSTTVGPIVKAFAEYFMTKNPNVNVTVSESGSGNGATSLINGACQIASMSRFMKDEEFKAAVEKGVFPVAQVIALDGLAIVVHPGNPVADLKIEQVREIYLGTVKNWNELGGPDAPIVRISRDTNSGTYECFEGLVMNKAKMTDEMEYVGSNGAVRQRVQSTPGAIGYVGLGFVEGVKALKIGGVEASAETVVSGRYPLARPLFLFTNGYPALGSRLQQFVSLYLTEKGQEIVEATGFVPVTQY
ncbi:MAG: phosphate ABC transporter substrate-binding protein [Candidatus Sumerlaeota bacterium]|nr:phosphate ABC transporter substrate-binding protein [Candidatus Sumerlaeota bacterium]